MARDAGRGAQLRLGQVLRANQEEVLRLWEREVDALRPARRLPRSALRDHLPVMLSRLADLLDEPGSSPAVVFGDLPDQHALVRLEEGFDLGDVALEYTLLRTIVLRVWQERGGPGIDLEETIRFNLAIDAAVRTAVARYASARHRLLQSLDRISRVALDGGGLPRFLDEMVRAVLETTEAADSVAVFLVEGDTLRLRAAAGLQERDLAAGFTLGLGEEGLAGWIAAQGRPSSVSAAASDPRIESPSLREAGARGLYGVPLMREQTVLGVAAVASCSAAELWEEDRLLLRSMATRAAVVIDQNRLAAAQTAAQEGVQRAAGFQEMFVGIVSHDLRNPLGAIAFSAETLLGAAGNLSPPQLKAARRIGSCAAQMGRMITDLLDLTRARLGGGIPVSRGPASLHDVCRRVVEELSASHPGRALRLSATGDGAGEWDGDRLYQLASNLVGNALQHGLPEAPVEVSVRGEGAAVVLEVHNAGVIPEDQLPTLFEPFRGAEGRPAGASPSRGGNGGGSLGLGLYIVERIVAAHDGSITVRSTEAEGTTFTARLPRRPPPPAGG